MSSKLAHEDKGRVRFSNWRRQRNEYIDVKPDKPCSFSSFVSTQQQGPKNKEKLIEFLCSSCLLCVCCPLAAICCCIKLPCRICRGVWQWACYGSKNRIFADYSSFSDIDSDVTSGNKVKPSSVSEEITNRFHHLLCK